MIGALALALLAVAGPATARAAATPTPPRLVDAAAQVPGLRLDLRYATPNNFTGRALYPAARCLLRPAVAAQLARAQAAAAREGLGLKVFDCYRPLAIQRHLWALVPDERYVADPSKGSRHNRGAAVDLTLVDASGAELSMPTGFDDFSARAHRDYADLPADAVANRARLERLMTAAGFTGLPTEWWHFDADGWERYEVLDLPLQ